MPIDVCSRNARIECGMSIRTPSLVGCVKRGSGHYNCSGRARRTRTRRHRVTLLRRGPLAITVHVRVESLQVSAWAAIRRGVALDAAGFVGGGEGGRAAGSPRTVYPDRRRSFDDAKTSTLCTNGPGHQRLGRNSVLVVILRFGSLRSNGHKFGNVDRGRR